MDRNQDFSRTEYLRLELFRSRKKLNERREPLQRPIKNIKILQKIYQKLYQMIPLKLN